MDPGDFLMIENVHDLWFGYEHWHYLHHISIGCISPFMHCLGMASSTHHIIFMISLGKAIDIPIEHVSLLASPTILLCTIVTHLHHPLSFYKLMHD